MKHAIILIVLILGLFSTDILAQRRPIVGNLKIHTLKSDVFNNTRKIRVLLPEGYVRSKESYPVLYLQDGQNLFNHRTAQVSQMEWGVDETVKSLVRRRRMKKIIVVGVDNPGRSVRGNEYLPWKDEYLTPVIENPRGSDYPSFLTEEVMPFVEGKYRVAKGPENTVIGGASYGALISLYTVLKKPDVFGGIILESPSFYVNDRKILDLSADQEKWPAKVHLGVGTNEEAKRVCKAGDESHEAVVDVKRFQNLIGEKAKVQTVIERCAVHGEVAWGARLTDALVFLFPYERPVRKK